MKKQKTKFKLPKKIRLLSDDFKILFEDLSKSKGNEDDDAGIINFNIKTITFDNSIKDSPQDLKFIFFHEIAHFYSKYYGLEPDSEIFANAFSNFIVNILEQLEKANEK